jgi:nucleoid-associated protein YgaU
VAVSERRLAASVVVHPGDSLWAIARRHLDEGAGDVAVAREVDRMWSLNASRLGLRDPDLIWPGMHLRT